MAWVDFSYTVQTDKKTYESIYTPLIDVHLVSPKGFRILNSFLVDSGALDTAIDEQMAEALGIDLDKCKKRLVKGIGTQEIEGRVCEIQIFIAKFKTPMTVDALFVPNLGVGGLLGQRDLFTHFYVKFDKPHCKFSLASVPKLKF